MIFETRQHMLNFGVSMVGGCVSGYSGTIHHKTVSHILCLDAAPLIRLLEAMLSLHGCSSYVPLAPIASFVLSMYDDTVYTLSPGGKCRVVADRCPTSSGSGHLHRRTIRP
nr:hypothetical protein CFP56_62935 [Quercus suber]